MANVCGDLADDLLVNSFDLQFGVFRNRDLDAFRNREQHWMRETEAQVQYLALDGSLETDAMNLQILDESGGDPCDHVVNQSARKTMQGADTARF